MALTISRYQVNVEGQDFFLQNVDDGLISIRGCWCRGALIK